MDPSEAGVFSKGQKSKSSLRKQTRTFSTMTIAVIKPSRFTAFGGTWLNRKMTPATPSTVMKCNSASHSARFRKRRIDEGAAVN